MLKQLGFCFVLLVTAFFTPADAQESPTYQLPPVTVRSQPESQERVGPYQQPAGRLAAGFPRAPKSRSCLRASSLWTEMIKGASPETAGACTS